MPACKPLLIALSIALAAGRAEAQPLVVTHETLEARIAQAEHVVVGTIAKVTETVLAAPGGQATEGQYQYAIVLKVDERLKGNAKDKIENLRVIRRYARDKRFEEWRDAKTSIVWFIAPPENANERGGWSVLRLGKSVPAEALYGQSDEPRLFASDLKWLKGEHAILDRARSYAKLSTKVLPTHTINMPIIALAKADKGFRNPWNHVIVPVDAALEPLAKRLIASPHEFVAAEDELDDLSRYQMRFGGVCSLRHFRSETNVKLLHSLLDDPDGRDIKSGYIWPVPIRVKAFEILLEWGVETPLPKSPEEVTRIDLASTAVTDESLKLLAGLTNLAYLDVSFTKVTHEGLKPLAGLKKLALIQLDDSQVTAAMLGTLREMGMLHTLPQAASAVRDVRPASDDEIVRLELYHIPLTDAGLKELVSLKNLADLRLQCARVTEAGLRELARLPKLTTLFLLQIKLTDAMLKEVAKIKSLTTLGLYESKYSPAALVDLQQTLPKCKLER